MTYKNFRINIVVRVIVLIATLFLLFFILFKEQYYITPILISILVIVQVAALIYYVEKTNRDVTSFLESIRFADFSRTFQVEGLGSSFDELKRAFNNVINDFQKIRSEKEEHFFYIQNILQHIDICIIAYNNDGSIEMINAAAKKLFSINKLKNIKMLSSWDINLKDTLMNIKPGENELIKVKKSDDLLQLSVQASEFVINEREIRLVSIKNIQSELEEQEMAAWQKLIRVLTHEIMNSIAPIASLSSTVNLMVKDVTNTLNEKLPEEYDQETIGDINDALVTIHKRSTGLIHFVDKYRNLTKIPTPNFKIYKVINQFTNINNLLEVELNKNSVKLVISVEPQDTEITADEQLIEQVLINMVKNSIHALDNIENPKIQMKAYVNYNGKNVIQVIDNGQGIIKEVGDKIFIPFFTTKSSGSGIGLSLSKQILRLHGGTINVNSVPDIETCFTLTF